MPITDDPTLCDDLLSALRAADRASDHSLGHRARAIVRDLIHDLALRSRLRAIIDAAVAAGDPVESHRLRRILNDADANDPGWQAAAYEALDD